MKTKTKIQKTRTLTRESPVIRRVKELLSEIVSVRSIDFWKTLGESISLVRAKNDPKLASEGADIMYLSKDRGHCLLIDCHVPEAGLQERQATLFIAQLAHLMKNRELPIKTVSLVFLVPAGSKVASKLCAAFNESYKIPTAGLRKSSLTAAGIKEKGARMAKNAQKYSVAFTYKEQKFDISITVKVVEAPASLFEGAVTSVPQVLVKERTKATMLTEPTRTRLVMEKTKA